MPYLVRECTANDAKKLAPLMEAYLRETYNARWGGDAAALSRDLRDRRLSVLAAETAKGNAVGFIAQIETYDLHWCVRGGEVIDFYVSPPFRGRGPAVQLVVELARAVLERGGMFLKGGAVDDPAVRKLYGKIAITQGNGEAYVSGRAFRHLAGLAARGPREIVSNLPQQEWNREP